MRNYGLWQGALSAGSNKIAIEYRSSYAITSGTGLWEARSLTLLLVSIAIVLKLCSYSIY